MNSDHPAASLLDRHKAAASFIADRLRSIQEAEPISEEEAAAIDREANATARARLFESFIANRGERYRECSLSNFETRTAAQREAVELLTAYLDPSDFPRHLRDGLGLTFFGPCGAGKDHLATAVCRAAICNYGVPVRYESGARLFGAFHDCLATKRPTGPLYDRYTRASLLLLSDPVPPGNEALSKYEATLIRQIVDERYEAKRPTIITVNVADGEEANTRLGAAVVDRLRHASLVVSCYFTSYRASHRPQLAVR
jgi:DNA replication protein DnaC